MKCLGKKLLGLALSLGLGIGSLGCSRVAPNREGTARGKMIDLESLGSRYSWANSINEEGQIVGMSVTTRGEFHAFLWQEGQGMQDLGTLGGHSIAHSINNAGQVVGYSTTATREDHAFLWEAEKENAGFGDPGGAREPGP